MVCTPLFDALRVEVVAFVTWQGCYHIVSLEVLQADHALLHLVMLLLIKNARQLAEIDDTVHARRLTIVRICTIFCVSGLVVGTAFTISLLVNVSTRSTAQKSKTKDDKDN